MVALRNKKQMTTLFLLTLDRVKKKKNGCIYLFIHSLKDMCIASLFKLSRRFTGTCLF